MARPAPRAHTRMSRPGHRHLQPRAPTLAARAPTPDRPPGAHTRMSLV